MLDAVLLDEVAQPADVAEELHLIPPLGHGLVRLIAEDVLVLIRVVLTSLVRRFTVEPFKEYGKNTFTGYK